MSVVPSDAAAGTIAEATAKTPHHPYSALNLLIDVVLVVFCVLILLPLLFLVSNAFKTPQEMLVWPPTLIPRQPIVSNFTDVLSTTPLLRWIGNSVIFAVLSTISIVATSSVGGYIFAKFKFRSLHFIFILFLATAIVPFEIYMIPLNFQAQQMHILNSIRGLLLGYMVMGFGIFLNRQNVEQTIPNELLDAARIDGASEIAIFVLIVLPLLRGALAALAVLAFFQAWTAFAWPLIVGTTKDSYTIEVGLALLQTGFTIDLGRLSAASTIVLVPSVVLFAILRRNFVRGITATGIKEWPTGPSSPRHATLMPRPMPAPCAGCWRARRCTASTSTPSSTASPSPTTAPPTECAARTIPKAGSRAAASGRRCATPASSPAATP